MLLYVVLDFVLVIETLTNETKHINFVDCRIYDNISNLSYTRYNFLERANDQC